MNLQINNHNLEVMARKSDQNISGTSYWGVTIRASVTDLYQKLGEPTYECNIGADKVNYEWHCETEAGDVFSIYDWKMYRPLSDLEVITWHIGAFSEEVSNQAKEELYHL